MKLSENEIQKLYNFCRKRLIKHYDLQTELVDHWANGIEKQWAKDAKIDFDTALELEFKKFGHFGFRTVLKQRKKAINKKHNRIIWHFYKEYFKMPKIMGVLFGGLALFLVLRNLPIEYKWLIVSLAILPVAGYFMYVAFRRQKAYHAKIGIEKRWMLQEKIFTMGGAGAATLNLFHVFNSMAVFKVLQNNMLLDAMLSPFIICLFTLFYVMIFVIPGRAEEILAQQYPEYKLVSKKWR